jgi:hypothetical protein
MAVRWLLATTRSTRRFYDKLNYNFIRDIAPVASVTRGPYALVASVPAKTVPEFIAYTRLCNLDRGQDGRDVSEIDGKHVVVGIAIVLGSAVAAIVERHDEPRHGRGSVSSVPIC